MTERADDPRRHRGPRRPATSRSAERTAKAERTRARILDAALQLFREVGFDGATMRVVAERAGVSVGNAYYYFSSKDELVLRFYSTLHREHQERVDALLGRERDLRARLAGVLHAHFDVAAPYHAFAGGLFKTAADPASPLNPFGEASRALRVECIDMMRRVVDGSRARVHGDVAGDLPELLWTYHMGLVLFWIHDHSPDQERTRRLVDRTSELVVRLISMAGLPLLGGLRGEIAALMGELRPTPPGGGAGVAGDGSAAEPTG